MMSACGALDVVADLAHSLTVSANGAGAWEIAEAADAVPSGSASLGRWPVFPEGDR
jgi:hypothetical protein